jgi:hypothetical protein
MLSRNRLTCSLVVALFLSTLALADSAPVSIDYLHSSTGAYAGSQSFSDHSASSWRTGTLMIVAGFDSPSSEKSNALANVQLPGNKEFAQVHGTVGRKNGQWGVWHTPPTNVAPGTLATPEPSGLMLLSTGLIGIGTLRRKLRRA